MCFLKMVKIWTVTCFSLKYPHKYYKEIFIAMLVDNIRVMA